MQNKPLIENQSLIDEFKKTIHSDGYLVCLTRRKDGKLFFSWYTDNFSKEDIPKTLAHYSDSLKREMGATVAEEPKIDKKELILPPEYRNNEINLDKVDKNKENNTKD